MNNLALKEQQDVARPLKVLVPVIQREIQLGDEAGIEHYKMAGEALLEAKDQVMPGEFGAWVKRNFNRSLDTARRYMALAEAMSEGKPRTRNFRSLQEFVEPEHSPRYRSQPWHEPVKQIITERVDVGRLAQEQQNKEKELHIIRQLAAQLIDIGYKVLVTKLHPDKGGSTEAMSRLNDVRRRLKQSI